jgi:hypothetical protein
MKEALLGAQGFKNLLVFASSALIVICLFFSVSSASAQGSAATQSQVVPGQQVQLEGEFEIIYEDFKDGHHTLSYSLKRSDGTQVPLQFAKEPPTHLLSGDHVRVSGQSSATGALEIDLPRS